MYEEIEKGNINIDILNYFEEQNIIDHISGIMSYDFEIFRFKQMYRRCGKYI